MDLSDRATHILIGMLIGAVLGYFTRVLQEINKKVDRTNVDLHDIKEEVDEIDSIVKTRRERDESGFARVPWVANLILFSVVAMTVWASFSTGITNNKLEDAVVDIQENQTADDAQEIRIQKVTSCTLQFTSKTIEALNERTKYSNASASANADVLKAQQEFLEIILQIPPPSDADALAALRTYTTAVGRFNQIADKSKAKRNQFAYPTNEELANCLGVSLTEVENGPQVEMDGK